MPITNIKALSHPIGKVHNDFTLDQLWNSYISSLGSEVNRLSRKTLVQLYRGNQSIIDENKILDLGIIRVI